MGNKKGSKARGPKAAYTPSVSKTPRVEAAPNAYDLHPSWRISSMEMIGPFGWQDIPTEKVLEIINKLSAFEKLTWKEILVERNQGHHRVAVSKLIREAQERLREVRQDDIDELVSLRLSGRERVWGILEGGVLRILWWDAEHQICPSIKKHT